MGYDISIRQDRTMSRPIPQMLFQSGRSQPFRSASTYFGECIGRLATLYHQSNRTDIEACEKVIVCNFL